MSDTATPLQQPTSADTDFMSQHFFVVQRLLKMQTVTLVQVAAVYPASGSLVGKVDVLPLVNQVDGAGNSIPHVTLYGRPYLRIQGGTNAIICDPTKGDIGIMVFGSRDLSSVIASGKAAPPASGRYFNRADGIYLYSLARGEPEQYLAFLAGIELGSPSVSTTGNLNSGTGATGSFVAAGGQTVDVQNGIITGIF